MPRPPSRSPRRTSHSLSPRRSPRVAAPIASEPERVSVPTGSTLKLDGESLGSDAGVVRLRISGVAMPVEVVEWSADSTKIRLPKLDVTEATKAELEVVRADGTLASTNAISLTPPPAAWPPTRQQATNKLANPNRLPKHLGQAVFSFLRLFRLDGVHCQRSQCACRRCVGNLFL